MHAMWLEGFMECLNKMYALIFDNQCVYVSKLTDELMRYTHWYQCIHLINIPKPVHHHIDAMAFPFDLRCESVTLEIINKLLST